MKSATQCLQPSDITALLAGKVPASQSELWEEHFSSCESCRFAMAGQVGDQEWWREAEQSLMSAPIQEASGSTTDEADERESIEELLKLLGPTDDPQMLGRIGSYEVLGVLGRGGMGVVFKAFDAPLSRFVAIKMLLPHLAASGAARKRFAREGQAVAAVVDDHVMAIHCVDEWQGVPYLVMTYSRGVSLQKRLSDNGPLETREILRIGMQAAKGLAAAHAQGIVHRDIKPANIFLDQNVERVQLMDFGLARAVDDASLTRSGTLAGTPQYMSPEQARAETVDHRSDLFSLGSVLYAMCTGHAPFRAESSYSVLRLITDKEPRPIRELNPDVPEWLCAVIGKLMAKQPEDRYASSEEVADLLEGCLAHVQQPTTTPLPSPVAKLAKIFGPHGDKRAAESLGDFRYPPIGKFIAAAAFAFSLIFAGVLIVLELNKGTLTIESDVDNVPIRIMQADKVVEQLKVSKQGQTVRVAAGDYIVELDGEFTNLSVGEGVVSIRRGDTGTVKIATTGRGIAEGKGPSTVLAAIKKAIERDSAISEKQWRSLDARNQEIEYEKVKGTPLMLMFLSMRRSETLSKSMKEGLELFDSVTSAGVLDEIERNKGPYTFFHADRITEIDCEIDKDTAAGNFSFLVPGLYKGKIEFRAKSTNSGWRITEFLLPAYGIQLVRNGESWESKVLVPVKDGETFQGEWHVASVHSRGRKVVEAMLCTYQFTGDKMKVTGHRPCFAEMTLRSDSMPKEIDLVVLEGVRAGKVAHGIYRFDGDRLVLCLGKNRPRKFSGDGEAELIVLERRQIKGSSKGVETESVSDWIYPNVREANPDTHTELDAETEKVPDTRKRTKISADAESDSQTKPVDFVLGQSNLANGDQIEIQSVTTSGNGLEVGETVTVKGTYTLSSEDTANLCFFSTTKRRAGETPTPTPVQASQRMKAKKGKHTFSLSKVIRRIGSPHVSFYHQATGKSMGGVYFSEAAKVETDGFLARLQGDWNVVQEIREEGTLKRHLYTASVLGKRMDILGDGMHVVSFDLAIGLPHQIDLRLSDRDRRKWLKGVADNDSLNLIYYGIIESSGNTLRICNHTAPGNPRPTEFTDTAGYGIWNFSRPKDEKTSASANTESEKVSDTLVPDVELPSDTQVHVVGCYGPVNHQPIEVFVKSTGKPMVVVMCCYEVANWNWSVDPEADVRGVILSGYNIQQFSHSAPKKSVPTIINTYSPVWKGITNSEKEERSKKCFSVDSPLEEKDFQRMLERVAELTGRNVTSFQTIAEAKEFVIDGKRGLEELEIAKRWLAFAPGQDKNSDEFRIIDYRLRELLVERELPTPTRQLAEKMDALNIPRLVEGAGGIAGGGVGTAADEAVDKNAAVLGQAKETPDSVNTHSKTDHNALDDEHSDVAPTSAGSTVKTDDVEAGIASVADGE